MLKTMRHRGFTLIELMVGLAILAILLVLGIPTMTHFLDSSRLKAATTSFSSGLQYARSQAVSRNERVQFTSNGAGWSVATVAAPLVVLQSRSNTEGGATRVNMAEGSGVASAIFNGLGASIKADGTPQVQLLFSFTSPDNACAPTGPIRCLDVRVSPAGQVRLCDPAAAAGDSRAC